MLVQFMFKNVLSFKKETILDMTAINAYKEHEYNLITGKQKNNYLKVAAIYGANASGKSNLHLAMHLFQNIILESLENVSKKDDLAIKKYYQPYSFDQDKENSEFQIIIIVGDFEYKYGFEYNDKEIFSEWMYKKSFETNRTSTILERTIDTIKFGASIRSECESYGEQIPPDTLVLSFFNKLKLKTNIFKEVFSGIMDILVEKPDFCENPRFILDFLPNTIDNDKHKLLEFLRAIDTGISDIYYRETENEIEMFTKHIGKDGNSYSLSLFNESEGTIKSIALFILARIAISNNASMFIDELNIKLHPLLLKFITDLFYREDSNAQLIYTTHDTTLLDKRFFRRDQIWFVQKDEYGYSELTALSDFRIRSDASFEKDYLAGVYGGIPLIREFELQAGE